MMVSPFNPYRGAQIIPGQYARKLMADQVIVVADAVHVVQNHQESWPGRENGQLWCRGQAPNGTTLKVLMDPVIAGQAGMVLVYTV